MTTTVENQVRRLRRSAKRQGLTLTKSGKTYILAEPTKRGLRQIRRAGLYRLDAIEEELNKPPQELPPDFVADDGTVWKDLVFVPHWLRIGLHIGLHSGVVFVYRSVLIEDDEDQIYWPALDAIERLGWPSIASLRELPLLHSEIVDDENMMNGKAELAVYQMGGR